MRLNDRGDALTLAIGAAAFIGVSILVMATVMANVSSKIRRTRAQNEIDSIILSVRQLISNPRLCLTAFRVNGPPAGIFRPTPPWPVDNQPLNPPQAIDRIYLGPFPGGQILYCRDGDICTQNSHVTVRGMVFTMNNTAANHQIVDYGGDSTGRYRQITGLIRISFGARTGTMPFGGLFQAKSVPVQFIVDTLSAPANQIVMCYATESVNQICAEMGGKFNASTGFCDEIRPEECGQGLLVHPNVPCPAPPGGSSACPAPLVWTDVYYASGVDENLQVTCMCRKVCAPP